MGSIIADSTVLKSVVPEAASRKKVLRRVCLRSGPVGLWQIYSVEHHCRIHFTHLWASAH